MKHDAVGDRGDCAGSAGRRGRGSAAERRCPGRGRARPRWRPAPPARAASRNAGDQPCGFRVRRRARQPSGCESHSVRQSTSTGRSGAAWRSIASARASGASTVSPDRAAPRAVRRRCAPPSRRRRLRRWRDRCGCRGGARRQPLGIGALARARAAQHQRESRGRLPSPPERVTLMLPKATLPPEESSAAARRAGVREVSWLGVVDRRSPSRPARRPAVAYARGLAAYSCGGSAGLAAGRRAGDPDRVTGLPCPDAGRTVACVAGARVGPG